MLARMSFAAALSAREVRGVEVDLGRVFPLGEADIATEVCRQLLGEDAPSELVATVKEEIAPAEPDERRALAVALVIGSPEFQRQ
jgi:hypothetical protein